jgi:hypothetical protein
VTIALTPYLGLSSYVRETLRRRPEPYDAARGPAIYRGRAWTRPTGPLWRMSPAEVDAVPEYVELQSPQRFRQANIDAVVPAGVLTRDQILVLQAIRDSFPGRPIYFVFGGYGRALGLGPWLRQQGLVDRLEPDRVEGSADVMPIGGANVDVPRTLALWSTVYRGPGQLLREGRWVDAASSGIPNAYGFVGEQLAAGLAARGDTVRAAAVMDTVRQIAKIGGLPLAQ